MMKVLLHKTLPKGPSVREAKQTIQAQPQKGWVDLALRYGKNFTYQGSLVTCDPAVVEALLMERIHTQHRSRIHKYFSWIIPIAPGLLFMDGNSWQKRLRAVMPVFTRSTVDAYAERMNQIILDHTGLWQDEQVFPDLYNLVVNLNVSLFLQVGCGLDPNEALAQQLGHSLVDFKFHLMDSRTRLDTFGMSADQLRRLPRFLKSRWDQRLKKRRLRSLIRLVLIRQQPTGRGALNWIHRLQDAGFSITDTAGEVNHLYGAYNALDYVLTAALYELSKQPVYVETLRNELKAVIGDRGYPTHDDLRMLPNTLNFMKEVMRFYPVSMGVARRFGEATAVNGVLIPKGQEALILLHALHHHPDFWEHPEQFDPSRWERDPIPYSYVPFLTGPRKCIGQHLAEINFVIVLNVLIQSYSVEVMDPAAGLVSFMVPRFAKDLSVIIRRRTSASAVEL